MSTAAAPSTGNPRVDELMSASDRSALPERIRGDATPETASIKVRKALNLMLVGKTEEGHEVGAVEIQTRVETLLGEALARIEQQSDLTDAVNANHALYLELKQARRIIERQTGELRKLIHISRAPWPKGMVLRDSRNPAKRDTLIVMLSDGSVWEGSQPTLPPRPSSDAAEANDIVVWKELTPVPTTRAATRVEAEHLAKASA